MLTDSEATTVELTDDERRLLRCGLGEWGGPASPTEALAVAMGFPDLASMGPELRRLRSALDERSPLGRADWTRVLVATEIVFASDVLRSGTDWVYTTGFSDAESIALLRAVQVKIGATWRQLPPPLRPVVGP